MKYDLHVHSRYSDGSLTLSQLAALAKEQGLGGFAISDHDTIAGWQEIPQLEKKFGIKIIPAVEISTEENNHDVHILAYGLSENPEGVNVLLDKLSKSRIERIKTIASNLNKLGIEISPDDVYGVAGNTSPGRPHVAMVLIERGYVDSIRQAFDKYLGRGCPGYAPREKLSPYQCIKTINEDGGLAVLAHPGLDDAYKLIPKLADYGLWGVEVYHSSHNPGQEIKFKAIAKDFGLSVTGGSDFHSAADGKHGSFGSKFIEVDSIEEFFRNKGGKL